VLVLSRYWTSTWPSLQAPGARWFDKQIEAKQIVIAGAAPLPADHAPKWVDNEEQRRFDAVSSKIGTVAQPITQEVLLAELVSQR
jgi:hypothetical protein